MALNGLEELDCDVTGTQRCADFHRDALAREIVDDREHTNDAAVGELVVHEVHAPALDGSRRQRHRPTGDRLQSPATASAECEALLSVDASDSTLSDLEALRAHREVHASVSVPRQRVRCVADRDAKFVVVATFRFVSQGASALAHHAARSAFADAELRLQQPGCFAPRAGPHHFFPFTVFSI